MLTMNKDIEYKFLRVRPETYRLITAIKQEHESFNDAIERIITSGVIIHG